MKLNELNRMRELAGMEPLNEAAGKMSIDIDLCDWSGKLSDEETDALAHDLAKQFKCTAKLKNRVGPGGGNPEWTMTGTEKNLRALYRSYINSPSEVADAEFTEFFKD